MVSVLALYDNQERNFFKMRLRLLQLLDSLSDGAFRRLDGSLQVFNTSSEQHSIFATIAEHEKSFQQKLTGWNRTEL
jgi:hypothetical protein